MDDVKIVKLGIDDKPATAEEIAKVVEKVKKKMGRPRKIKAEIKEEILEGVMDLDPAIEDIPLKINMSLIPMKLMARVNGNKFVMLDNMREEPSTNSFVFWGKEHGIGVVVKYSIGTGICTHRKIEDVAPYEKASDVVVMMDKDGNMKNIHINKAPEKPAEFDPLAEDIAYSNSAIQVR